MIWKLLLSLVVLFFVLVALAILLGRYHAGFQRWCQRWLGYLTGATIEIAESELSERRERDSKPPFN